MSQVHPYGRRPRRLSLANAGIYAFLVMSALFFLLPFWIMLMTSLKPIEEIRLGNIVAMPSQLTYEPWLKAWAAACTGCSTDQGGPVATPVRSPTP